MATIDENISDLARAKAKVVEPLRGLRPIPSEKMIEACRRAGELLNLEEVSHQTIRNWLEILETKGVKGLDRKPHKNRGYTTMSPQLTKIAKGILLHPKNFSIAETQRRLARHARHQLNLPEDQIPSRKQIQYLWDHIPDEEKEMALNGIAAYRRKYDQSVRFEALHSNAIWQADHHQLDIIVIDPETGEELGRPWLTKIQDDNSRGIMGRCLSLDPPNSMSIASALYHAFLPKPHQEWWVMYGLPEVVYIDNGKDWISRHIELVALNIGFRLLRHEPYHPQSKGKIERLFRTLEEMCIHPLDGYVGSNLQNRPHRITPRLTLEQVGIKIDRFIRDYHERIHGTTKQKPRERWEQNLINHRQITDLTSIDHLLKSKPYTVHKYGIHFQNDYYLDSEGILGGYIGRRVTVFFDSRDTSRIRIWGRKNEDEEPHYLCTAYSQSNPDRLLQSATVAEHNKQRRETTRKNVRDAQKEGEQALKVLEDMDEREEAAEAVVMSAAQSTLPDTGKKPVTQSTTENEIKRSNRRSEPAKAEPDDELDYEAFRRSMQRKQRGGNGL